MNVHVQIAQPLAFVQTPEQVAASPALEGRLIDARQFAAWRTAFDDLSERAVEASPFMHPAVVEAAAATARVRVAIAIDPHSGRLAGAWAFAVDRPRSGCPVRLLRAPASVTYGCLSTPVLDSDRPDEALAALFDAIADSPETPSMLLLTDMSADGPVMACLRRLLTVRGLGSAELGRLQRPALASDLTATDYLKANLSASTRKKLRQHGRRLAERGAVTFTTHREPNDVAAALEEFLRLEAAGWKGARNTAFLSNEADATFIRSALTGLAGSEAAWIEALRVDGRPVAMQILLRSGRTAFTWKTAFDEQWHQFSPGILLMQEYTTTLLGDPSLELTDSCSCAADGFMGQMWAERREVVDLLLEARRSGWLWLKLVGATEHGFRRVHALAKRLYYAARKLRASRSAMSTRAGC